VHALLAIGALLQGRYQVVGWVGGGGFANVYRVVDLRLGHVRALKEAYGSDNEIRESFGLEADLLINSRHPNIPRGYNYFEEAGRLYLVMDYVDGQDLQWILSHYVHSTGAPPLEGQIISWILPICDAIAYMHQQRVPVIHRDIKPSNIKLTPRGVPMLIDFGLAKLAGRSYPARTAEGGFTPGYAPPEQAIPQRWTDARSDIYAMGATLYHLCTGQVPTDSLSLLQGLREGRTLVPPRAINAQISPQFEATILRAMQLDPALRYQTVHELRAALFAALTQQSVLLLGMPRETAKLPVTRLSAQPTQPPVRTEVAPNTQPLLSVQPDGMAGVAADHPTVVTRPAAVTGSEGQSDIATKPTIILDQPARTSSGS